MSCIQHLDAVRLFALSMMDFTVRFEWENEKKEKQKLAKGSEQSDAKESGKKQCLIESVGLIDLNPKMENNV